MRSLIQFPFAILAYATITTITTASPIDTTPTDITLAQANAQAQLTSHIANLTNHNPTEGSTESWGNPLKTVMMWCRKPFWQDCDYPVIQDNFCYSVPSDYPLYSFFIQSDIKYCLFMLNDSCTGEFIEQDASQIDLSMVKAWGGGNWGGKAVSFQCHVIDK